MFPLISLYLVAISFDPVQRLKYKQYHSKHRWEQEIFKSSALLNTDLLSEMTID